MFHANLQLSKMLDVSVFWVLHEFELMMIVVQGLFEKLMAASDKK